MDDSMVIEVCRWIDFSLAPEVFLRLSEALVPEEALV
jgi:hypothetical protein